MHLKTGKMMICKAIYVVKNIKSILRLGAQSSYVVKYFEGSNAVKTVGQKKFG